MASQMTQQYACEPCPEIFGSCYGTPDYVPVANFEVPDATARTFCYSADGRLYAYALPNVVRIFQAENAQLLQELALPNIVELNFSPRGTYLSTWERPVKLDDGSQHKNHRVFSVSTGEELTSFSQRSQEGWDMQYTISESHAIRLVGPEIQVFRPSEWSKGIVDKLRVEGATSVTLSPGLNPSVAVFVAEKKHQDLLALDPLLRPATCQKNFYKADRSQIKWNDLGTQVLLLTHTDVDKTNKSYYGENMLYLLSAAGNFDCRVTLDKEGPIHDFAWSPNSKEFGVVYGYMPAKSVLFDQRVRTLHDFGTAPHNYISFNPQGRLMALAGFGNLAGKITIVDRRTLNKVTTIDAPNTSVCQWSPDGRFLLTATLSPRLRVDNGVMIWHCTGPLMHVQRTEELYQTGWRPARTEDVPPFPAQIPPAPAPSASASQVAAAAKPVVSKGAYRPPGARGLAAPSIFKREDEGGAARMPTNGTHSPQGVRSPEPRGVPGAGARRHVPGAPPPNHSPSPGPGDKKKRKGKKGGEEGGASGAATPTDGAATPNKGRRGGSPRGSMDGRPKPRTNGSAANVRDAAPPPAEEPQTDPSLDPVAKKVRNLTKKLKAIEELKEKAMRGERLEATQVKKIDGEGALKAELASLGA
ncbi:eukaryotic translation initiation factor eIF2A-domain-containing protein [Schizophyllum amplum]|uniref:Eukaryotic translation initiation factor 2A n=1 Tax=Schizophyllum amplum TaxID=97359 RepID=A0A550BZB7_9AGAR|nr:eukaryotic translation initiation factor eIF2A-domain-containing protein [Auriculariopsis ampla]